MEPTGILEHWAKGLRQHPAILHLEVGCSDGEHAGPERMVKSLSSGWLQGIL
jgi:hypothetical protein